MKDINKKESDAKKKEVSSRIEKLDPNNNKNLPQKPVIKKDGDDIIDDGFEHRTSGDPLI